MPGVNRLERVKPATEHLTIVEAASGGSGDGYSGLYDVRVKDIRPVPRRRHPTLNYGLGVGKTERNILGEPAKRVGDVARSIAQRRKLRSRKHVRHFLEVSHVSRLDHRHLVQLLVVDEGW